MYAYEKEALNKGFKNIAGCDEAGRGPLAGPLVVACVMLDKNTPIKGVNDSKQLSETKREALFDAILDHALAYSIKVYSAKTVDKLNVYQTSKKGMVEAAKEIGNVDYLLTDAMPIKTSDFPVKSIIKGDQKSASIAAASILAKVTRDRIMVELGNQYPHYGFEAHKGYPTKRHLEAISQFGPLDVHRKTFNPIKDYYKIQQSFDL